MGEYLLSLLSQVLTVQTQSLLQLSALLLVDEPLIFVISCFRSGLPGKADVCDKPSSLCDSQKMQRIDTPVTMTHTWKLLQVPAQKLSSLGLTHQQCKTIYDLSTLLTHYSQTEKKKEKKMKLTSVYNHIFTAIVRSIISLPHFFVLTFSKSSSTLRWIEILISKEKKPIF